MTYAIEVLKAKLLEEITHVNGCYAILQEEGTPSAQADFLRLESVDIESRILELQKAIEVLSGK